MKARKKNVPLKVTETVEETQMYRTKYRAKEPEQGRQCCSVGVAAVLNAIDHYYYIARITYSF
jgi:hypothetical protein